MGYNTDMGKKTFFTIVIPTLNEEKYLPYLLKDLEEQTFKNFTTIVVDANSADRTQEVARKYGACLVKSGERNVCFQRNLGAEHSKSPWIVFMDADNRIPPNYLQEIKNYIDRKEPDILSTWMKADSNKQKDKLIATILNLFMDASQNTQDPYIMEALVVIRRDVFEKIGGFDSNVTWSEGHELLKKAIEKGFRYSFVKKPKYVYSFRRIRKMGAFKMLVNLSQIQLIKIIKKDLNQSDSQRLYPMPGGTFYKNKERTKMTLQELLASLFKER